MQSVLEGEEFIIAFVLCFFTVMPGSSAATLTEKKGKDEEKLFFLPHGPCNKFTLLILHLFFSFTHSAHSHR